MRMDALESEHLECLARLEFQDGLNLKDCTLNIPIPIGSKPADVIQSRAGFRIEHPLANFVDMSFNLTSPTQPSVGSDRSDGIPSSRFPARTRMALEKV